MRLFVLLLIFYRPAIQAMDATLGIGAQYSIIGVKMSWKDQDTSYNVSVGVPIVPLFTVGFETLMPYSNRITCGATFGVIPVVFFGSIPGYGAGNINYYSDGFNNPGFVFSLDVGRGFLVEDAEKKAASHTFTLIGLGYKF